MLLTSLNPTVCSTDAALCKLAHIKLRYKAKAILAVLLVLAATPVMTVADPNSDCQDYIPGCAQYVVDSTCNYSLGRAPAEVAAFCQQSCGTCNQTGLASEAKVLQSLQARTHGDYWYNRWPPPNAASSNHCGWYGVACDPTGHVVVLALFSNNLQGEISPELGQLLFLQYL